MKLAFVLVFCQEHFLHIVSVVQRCDDYTREKLNETYTYQILQFSYGVEMISDLQSSCRVNIRGNLSEAQKMIDLNHGNLEKECLSGLKSELIDISKSYDTVVKQQCEFAIEEDVTRITSQIRVARESVQECALFQNSCLDIRDCGDRAVAEVDGAELEYLGKQYSVCLQTVCSNIIDRINTIGYAIGDCIIDFNIN